MADAGRYEAQWPPTRQLLENSVLHRFSPFHDSYATSPAIISEADCDEVTFVTEYVFENVRLEKRGTARTSCR